ncbi:MAG: hypothetical protein V1922_02295 [bacterium]
MTSFDARRVHHTFQDFRASVSGLSERYPKISASLGSLAFGLIYLYGLPNLAEAASHPALLGVDNFIKNISPFGVPLGRETLEGLQYFMYVMSSGIVTGDAPSVTGKLVEFGATIATLGGIASQVTKFASASVKDWWDSTFNRTQRMLEGTEPLLERESPSHVLIGDSQIISDIAKNIVPDKDKKRPIVGIHPDAGKPPVWGSKIHYHFHAQPHELTDIFTQSKSTISYIRAVGLDRTEEITFACMDPDNALFYGSDAKMSVRPSFVTTLLNKITENKKNALSGKKINVIMNESPQLGGVKSIQEDISMVGQRCGFEPKIISPETLALDVIKSNIADVVKKRNGQSDIPIEIALVGEGNEEKDKKMLQRFKAAIAGIDMGNKTPIVVSLVEDRELDGVTIDGSTVKKEAQDKTLQAKFAASDLIFVYGDHDDGTSSLVNNILTSGGTEKEKIHAFIERPSAKYDIEGIYLDEDNTHCIYDMVMNAYSS